MDWCWVKTDSRAVNWLYQIKIMVCNKLINCKFDEKSPQKKIKDFTDLIRHITKIAFRHQYNVCFFPTALTFAVRSVNPQGIFVLSIHSVFLCEQVLDIHQWRLQRLDESSLSLWFITLKLHVKLTALINA